MAKILVVDDDRGIREMVALALRASGHEVLLAGDIAAAQEAVAREPVDLVICDIYMPGGTGLDLLAELQRRPSPPRLILITARGTVETAALANRFGAFDYLAKPFDIKVLLDRVTAALAPPAAGGPALEPGPETMIVGSHPAIVEVYKAVARVARLSVPVLILGETGTGKELVARALHRLGANPSSPFVPVNSGAIPDTLLESELFGHRKGAFTDAHRERRGALAQAAGGTVFLDEIGDVSAAFQVKLLRFLQDGVVRPLGADVGEHVDVRVLAATNRDLAALVAAGSFRQDLYFRLAAYEIRLPPLRERLTDLPALVAHFQRRAERELGLASTAPATAEALAALAEHAWPGNVRELEQFVRRMLIDARSLADAGAVRQALASRGAAARTASAPAEPTAAGVPLASLEEAERRHLVAVLAASGGNKSAAARILGIERKTLARKLRRLGIDTAVK
ncbi:MAG TPA: sigma-54 dependent transcriptional regulator [Thermoanaerobaculaceae bacterium]|nr:sigma-54 dependent transcriptional regulator [Thermoanaerobaculaceae bacterium]